MTLAQFAHVDNPVSFVRALREKLMPEAKKWETMNEVERKAAHLEEENKYLSAKEASRLTESQRAEKRAALEAKIAEVREAHKISEEDYDKTLESIVQGGKVPVEEITPEYVANYYAVTKQFESCEKILEAIDPALKEDASILRSLVNVAHDNPDFSEQDLRDVAEAMTGKKAKKAAQALSSKVRASESKRASTSAPKSAQNEPLTFDDLD
jgi:hypothetical protein